MKRRTLLTGLAAALAATSFSRSQAQQKTTIRWWYHFDDPKTTPDELVAAFEKANPGIKIQAENIPWGGGGDYDTRLYTALKDLSDAAAPVGTEYEQRFNAAMDDDFNTPIAVAVLFDLARDINKLRADDPTQAAALGALLRKLGGILGILQRRDYLTGVGSLSGQIPLTFTVRGELTTFGPDDIELFIAQRNAARKAKNWAESDRIRDELKAKGVILEDGPGGTTWRRA